MTRIIWATLAALVVLGGALSAEPAALYAQGSSDQDAIKDVITKFNAASETAAYGATSMYIN